MSEKIRTPKKIFVDGPIAPQFIADSIAKHSTQTNIGAHQIFLGQIRADVVEDKKVVAIDFSSYQDMADTAYFELREAIFGKYSLTCMHVYHSLGRIAVGEINLFVFVSAVHRKDAIAACAELVELIKTDLPIWGKEIFEDEGHRWKVNR